MTRVKLTLTIPRGTMLEWNLVKMRNQETGIWGQKSEFRMREPPHSVSGGAVDKDCPRKTLKFRRITRAHPLLNPLSSGAVDTGPMSHPPYYGQRDNG